MQNVITQKANPLASISLT